MSGKYCAHLDIPLGRSGCQYSDTTALLGLQKEKLLSSRIFCGVGGLTFLCVQFAVLCFHFNKCLSNCYNPFEEWHYHFLFFFQVERILDNYSRSIIKTNFLNSMGEIYPRFNIIIIILHLYHRVSNCLTSDITNV